MRYSLPMISVLALFASSCALEVMTEEEALALEAEEVAVQEHAIKNGIRDNWAQRGLVEISTSTQTCTGALLNQHWAITAAHCLGDNMTQREGVVWVTVKLFDQDILNTRVISTDASYVYLAPGYQCIGNPNCTDGDDDIALIRHGSLAPKYWVGADPNWTDSLTEMTDKDYLRLNGNLTPGSGALNDIGTINFYGRGAISDTTFVGSGTMRRMPITIRNASSHQFTHIVQNAQSPAGCMGDSGGPYIGTVSGFRVIAAVFGIGATDHVNNCIPATGWQNGTRVDVHLPWITDTIGTCVYGWHRTRCW